jgi:hypothetical protein
MVQILPKFDFLQIFWLEECSFIYSSFQSKDINIFYVNPGLKIVGLTYFMPVLKNVEEMFPYTYQNINRKFAYWILQEIFILILLLIYISFILNSIPFEQIFLSSKKTSRMLLFKEGNLLHTACSWNYALRVDGYLKCHNSFLYDVTIFLNEYNFAANLIQSF